MNDYWGYQEELWYRKQEIRRLAAMKDYWGPEGELWWQEREIEEAETGKGDDWYARDSERVEIKSGEIVR